MPSVRNDFLSCEVGDAIRIIAGKYEGHLGLFSAVKKTYIEVRVRKVAGYDPIISSHTDQHYIPSQYLSPSVLSLAKDLDDIANLQRDIDRMMVTQRNAPPAPLYLGSSPAIMMEHGKILETLTHLDMKNTDFDLVEYTLDLAKMVHDDILNIHNGRETFVAYLSRTRKVYAAKEQKPDRWATGKWGTSWTNPVPSAPHTTFEAPTASQATSTSEDLLAKVKLESDSESESDVEEMN
jgi:hypothetical protein